MSNKSKTRRAVKTAKTTKTAKTAKTTKTKVYTVKPGRKTTRENLKTKYAMEPKAMNILVTEYRKKAKRINKTLDKYKAMHKRGEDVRIPIYQNPQYKIDLEGNIFNKFNKPISKRVHPYGYYRSTYRVDGSPVDESNHLTLIKSIICAEGKEEYFDLLYNINNHRRRWDLEVDHIDNDKGNNTITNLQILCHLDNCHKNRRKSNTGEYGIYEWNHPKLGVRYYVAFIADNRRYGGNRKYLGDAIALRNELMSQYNVLAI